MSKKIYSKLADFNCSAGEGSYGLNFKEFIDTLIESGEPFLISTQKIDNDPIAKFINIHDFINCKYPTYECHMMVMLKNCRDKIQLFQFIFDKFSNQCGRVVEFPTIEEMFPEDNLFISSGRIKLYRLVERINSKIKLIDKSSGIIQWKIVSNLDTE